MIRMSQPQERLELEYSRQKEIANADALIQEEAQYLHGKKIPLRESVSKRR